MLNYDIFMKGRPRPIPYGHMIVIVYELQGSIPPIFIWFSYNSHFIIKEA
jgi:hypothetical protein